MSRYLLLDVGAGTLDLLCWDDDSRLPYKAVVSSPVRTVARRLEAMPGDLLVLGCEMGGGPVTEVLRERARRHRVVMSASAAATLHHDVERVRSWGIVVVDDGEAEALRSQGRIPAYEIGDLEIERIRAIVESIGVPYAFDAVAVCAQDHGAAPPGVSHLDFRHRLYRERLETEPRPETLLFDGDAVPEAFHRLGAIAAAARRLPTDGVFVMDSGMAAVLGAASDPAAQTDRPVAVLDVATSHTVAAVVQSGEVLGWFEYHTRDVDAALLDRMIPDLADGKLSHASVLAAGGHGAAVFRACGFSAVERVVATGPRRSMMAASRLPLVWGAPLGDNMMTGTLGLLNAVRLRRGLPPVREA
jgi:uncharacterized protein (DUF1786 family)